MKRQRGEQRLGLSKTMQRLFSMTSRSNPPWPVIGKRRRLFGFRNRTIQTGWRIRERIMMRRLTNTAALSICFSKRTSSSLTISRPCRLRSKNDLPVVARPNKSKLHCLSSKSSTRCEISYKRCRRIISLFLQVSQPRSIKLSILKHEPTI